MPLSNDERGWVMTSLSAIACILGASIICVDLLIRHIPGKQNFRIQDSDAFLSISLSLSFGVMIFSSLYSMLPSAKTSLHNGGYSPKAAAWILIACFLGGVAGVQILSRIIHHFIPSHIVDCEHEHEEEPVEQPAEQPINLDGTAHEHDHQHSREPAHLERPRKTRTFSLPGHMQRSASTRAPNSTPRERQQDYFGSRTSGPRGPSAETAANLKSAPTLQPPTASRRPSLQQRLTSSFSQLTARETKHCDSDGPCYGFTEPCGHNCCRHTATRNEPKASTRPSASRNATMQNVPATISESTPLLPDIAESPQPPLPLSSHVTDAVVDMQHPDVELGPSSASSSTLEAGDSTSTSDHHHHHHVPTNAFLSIGLQTSIAIALHKLPEGFITYATNHANPTLGFSVFLALFIHNITEGFALALPLYLALGSRTKAMIIAFALGGLSQPLGAGVAALWFGLAGKDGAGISEAIYGGMFAVTAGIMASVALQLFSEGLEMARSRTLCVFGAFVGMGVLGISGALTAR